MSFERPRGIAVADVGYTNTKIMLFSPDLVPVAARFELDEALLADSPFVLAGSVEQVVDTLERVRERTGISHYVISSTSVVITWRVRL